MLVAPAVTVAVPRVRAQPVTVAPAGPAATATRARPEPARTGLPAAWAALVVLVAIQSWGTQAAAVLVVMPATAAAAARVSLAVVLVGQPATVAMRGPAVRGARQPLATMAMVGLRALPGTEATAVTARRGSMEPTARSLVISGAPVPTVAMVALVASVVPALLVVLLAG